MEERIKYGKKCLADTICIDPKVIVPSPQGWTLTFPNKILRCVLVLFGWLIFKNLAQRLVLNFMVFDLSFARQCSTV